MEDEKDLLKEWRELPPGQRDSVFRALCSQYGVSALLRNGARFHTHTEQLPLEDLWFIRRKPRKIHTIGIYYIWLKPGGVQRVMLYMAELYIQMGYRVVIITDQEKSETDYPLPDTIQRIVLGIDSGLSFSDRVALRTDLWERVIRENGIDLIDYNAWTSPDSFWDFTAIKYFGAGVVLHTHSIAVYGMRENLMIPVQVLNAARLADAVVVLNRMDVQFFKRANRNVYWIPNPHGEMTSKHPAGIRTGNRVVWCGRLSPEKDPISAVKAFSLVHEVIPKAHMTLVGGSNSGDWYTKIVEQEIERLNLRESITMTGMVHDVEQYYHQADVLICTSEYEGFCLTLMEAAEFSLPIITFDMPYLEILRRVPDIIRVPQKDVKALAGKMVEVLQDGEKRTRLGSSIRGQMAEIRDMNLTDQWQTVLKSIEEGTEKTEQELMDSESTEILINTMLEQYAEGSEFKKRQICAMEQSRQEMEKELERKNREAELLSRKLKETEARNETMRQECKYWEEKAKLYEHSLSFRVGRMMTKPIRLLRGIFKADGK